MGRPETDFGTASRPDGPGKLILLICALGFAATAAVAYFAFERLPHLEDEVAYLFQAKTMALDRLTVPSPAHPDSHTS